MAVVTLDNGTEDEGVTDSRQCDTAGSSEEDVECDCDRRGGAMFDTDDTVATCNVDEVVTGVTSATDVVTGMWEVRLA